MNLLSVAERYICVSFESAKENDGKHIPDFVLVEHVEGNMCDTLRILVSDGFAVFVSIGVDVVSSAMVVDNAALEDGNIVSIIEAVPCVAGLRDWNEIVVAVDVKGVVSFIGTVANDTGTENFSVGVYPGSVHSLCKGVDVLVTFSPEVKLTDDLPS